MAEPRRDPSERLPDDVAVILRDTKDPAVFELVAEWANAPSNTASAKALADLIACARGDCVCKRCGGTGELTDDPDDYLTCPDCDGKGEVDG